ncbi:MAG: SGNH/GDSL hydrolase family protein [Acidobacteriota bacterium]
MKTLGLRLAVVTVGLLAALLVAEVALRTTGFDLNPNPRLRWDGRFGWTFEPGYSCGPPGCFAEGRIDGVGRDGFRKPPVARAKAPGVRRLVILGDSISAGTAYPYAHTFAGRLQAWFDGGGAEERWEILNFGVDGWGTAQQWMVLEEEALSYQPDAVVLQVLPFNDVCNNNLAQLYTCGRQDFHRPYLVPEGDRWRKTWADPSRARLRQASRLFGAVEIAWLGGREEFGADGIVAFDEEPNASRRPNSRRRSVREQYAQAAGLEFQSNLYSLVPDPRQPPAVRRGWQVTERLVGEIARRLDAQGVPLYVLVVPFVETFDASWLARKSAPGPWPRSATGAELLPSYGTDRMERVASDLGLTVISGRREILARAMQPTDYFYPPSAVPDRHLNGFGHRAAAGWILDALAADGFTRLRPPEPAAAVDLLAPLPHAIALRGLWNDWVRDEHRGEGPETRLAFAGEPGAQPLLRFELESRFNDLPVQIFHNGRPVLPGRYLQQGEKWAGEVRLQAEEGRNEVIFRCSGPLPGDELWALRFFRLELVGGA